MNRCPGCHYLVPHAWAECRRCGTSLPVHAREPALVGAATAARSPSHGALALVPRPASRAWPGPVPRSELRHLAPVDDTLLPHVHHAVDTLLPRVHRVVAPRTRPHVSRPILTGAVVVALAGTGWATWRAVDGIGGRRARGEVLPTFSSAAADTGRARAETTLRTAADAARTLFIGRGSYADLRPDDLAREVRSVAFVDGTTPARRGQVSVRADGETTLVLASPASDDVCVFARDLPIDGRTDGVAVRHGGSCSADHAPARGWAAS